MTHLDRRPSPVRLVVLGLLVVAAGCGGNPGEDKKLPEDVETIGFVQGLSCYFGSRSTAPQFTNNTKFDLTDLDMKITFTSREPGVQERHETVHWDSWRKGEKRTAEVRVEAGKYYKVFVKGTAKRDGTSVKVSFGAEIFK